MEIKKIAGRAILLLGISLVSVAEETVVAIDEIVVSADYRARTVAAMPASVQVIDAATLEETATQHFEELVNLVPNLNWSGDGHRIRYIQIRGVGELEQYQGAPNPSIGFLIDDIDFSGIGSVATLFDIQSVDILRGSQGSRYGANALGGLVYMRSAAPTEEWSGRLQLNAADDNAVSIGGAIGGAVNDKGSARFRVSAQHHESDGFRRNTYLNRTDTNGRQETTLRGRLQLDGSEDFTANIAVLYANVDNGYDAFAIDNSYTVLSDNPGRDAQESLGASLRLDWSSFGAGELSAVTAFAHSDIVFSFDADWGNEDAWAPITYDFVSTNDRVRQTLSQELRYETDTWLIGVYALRLEDDLDSLNVGEYFDPGFNFADSLNAPFSSRYTSTNLAAFGQYYVDIGDASHFSAGLRIERRTTDYSDSDGLTADPDETLWGGEIALSHDFTSSTVGYVSASRGYKAGGFNLGQVPPEFRSFGDEALWSLESGIKASLFDDRMQLNASVFHLWREEQQVRASFQLDPGDPASFVFATVNVDGGRNYGTEIEMRLRPHPEIEAYANLGLLFGGFPGSVEPFSNLSGRDQAHAPRHTLAVGASYIRDDGFFLRVDASAKASFYYDVSHNQESRPYELVNARLGYQGEEWQVALWGRNLTDRRYTVRGFFFGNEPPDFPATLYTRLGDARQLGIVVERSF